MPTTYVEFLFYSLWYLLIHAILKEATLLLRPLRFLWVLALGHKMMAALEKHWVEAARLSSRLTRGGGPAGSFLQRKKHNHKPHVIILENLYMALVEKRKKIARF